MVLDLLGLLAYFAAGVVGDYLIARYYLALSRRRVCEASLLAAAITMFSVYVLATIVVRQDIGLIFAYAAGTGAGTFLAVRRH
jgi:hypothetical protein